MPRLDNGLITAPFGKKQHWTIGAYTEDLAGKRFSMRKQTPENRKTDKYLIVVQVVISVSRFQSLCRCSLSKPGIGLSSKSMTDPTNFHQAGLPTLQPPTVETLQQ